MAAPGRTAGNYRAYTADHLRRLSFIRRCRDLGFTIEQIRGLLRLADRQDDPCDAVDQIAREHIDEVERKIADLTHLARELRQLSDRCRGGKISECRIIEALGPRAEMTS